jgi:hypothetical protein
LYIAVDEEERTYSSHLCLERWWDWSSTIPVVEEEGVKTGWTRGRIIVVRHDSGEKVDLNSRK